MALHKQILAGCLLTTLALVFLAFFIIWIIIPVSFMLSLPFQTFMVFIPIESPRNPQFHNPEQHNITGVYNLYRTVVDEPTGILTSIGIWLILPEGYEQSSTNPGDIIRNNSQNILIYLHGVFANRAKPIFQYNVFRKHFLILAIDHRGYGDSGQNVDMTEIGIVRDHLQIYDWVRSLNPTVDIYYWGHSLGTGLSTHTLRLLKEEKNETPKGLILESPFTSYEDIIVNIVLGQIFGWLTYFDYAILQPLRDNGLQFRSYDHIRSVDCPIMILHAEDDGIVPYKLGEELDRVSRKNRTSDQGPVVFHGFPADLRYSHNDILTSPDIDNIIRDFVGNLVCCAADVLEGKGLVQVAITVTELLRFHCPRSPMHPTSISTVV